MSATETASEADRECAAMIALFDQVMTMHGRPTYAGLCAASSVPLPDDAEDPRTFGTALAEIRRQRAAVRTIAHDLAAIRMLLQRGDIPKAHPIVVKAHEDAVRIGLRASLEALPPQVAILAFEREARIARTLTTGGGR